MAFVQNAQEKAKNAGYNCINPTPHTKILHPILHPKSSVNTGHLAPWCRKCRRISKTFFVEGGRKNAMQRSGKCKTSDFFGQKYGCFASKVRMFSSKKSDVFVFRGNRNYRRRFRRAQEIRQLPPLRLVSSLMKGRSAESVTLQPSPSMPGMGGTSLRTLTLAARTMGKATRIAWSRRPQRCSRS